MIELRPYQLETIEKVRKSIMSGNRSIIIQANCGAGKTIMAAHIIKKALEKQKKIIFLVHFRQLAYQAMERFTDFGMANSIGYIMAGEDAHLDRPIQIISVQTYGRRLNLEKLKYNKWFKEADIAVYDECHSSIAPTRKAILDLYKKTAIIIGLTATPCRADMRPLGSVYDDIVSSASVKELTDQGFLVPVRYFGATHYPDLNNMGPDVSGDYNQTELGHRVDKPKLVGDILENWLRIAENRPTVIFATNVRHSKHIEELFMSNGIPTEHVDHKTSQDERVEILKRFKDGATRVITNCSVFAEGADFPWASCLVLAKPTKSRQRYIQMGGRVLRPYPGKSDCILIDHAMAVAGGDDSHGFLDEEVEWTLSGKEKTYKKINKKEEEKEKKISKCRACNEMFSGTSICPMCGTELKTFGKSVKMLEAELKELNIKKEKANLEVEKRVFLGMLKFHIPLQKNPNPKRIYGIFKGKYGCFPENSYSDVAPIEPDALFLNYMKYCRIKYAKRKNKT